VEENAKQFGNKQNASNLMAMEISSGPGNRILEWRKAKPKRLQKHVTLSAQIEGLADAQMHRWTDRREV